MNFHDIGMEKALLASLMSIEDSFELVAETVDVEDFALDAHKTLFRCIKALAGTGTFYDNVMVEGWLKDNKVIKAVGEHYIADILSTRPATRYHLITYAEKVKNLSIHRALARKLDESRDIMGNPDIEIEEKLNNIIESLNNVAGTEGNVDDETVMISDLIGGFFENLADAIAGKKRPFIPTGFLDLDLKAPIENGNLVIVAARPSMGKTTLAMNIMENMVANQCQYDDAGNITSRKTAMFFSLEMDRVSITTRFMASQSVVNMNKLRAGKNVDEDDWASMMKVATLHKAGFPLAIDDRSFITCQQIRTTLNKMKRKGHEIGVVVIDYLQIMGGIDENNKASSIGKITSSLKAIAKEFSCPIIALSQLNRDLEKRPNKRPVNSDLRDSGSIEQDADVIMFVYRDEVYNENSEHKGVAEIIIGKNRQGEIGTVRLGFEGAYGRFSNHMPYHDSMNNGPIYT